MRRRHLESVSSRSLSVKGSWGTAPSVFWFLLYAQKERPGGEPHRLCTLQNQRDAARRDETIAIVCAVNPSVSLTAASSPYTGEPLG